MAKQPKELFLYKTRDEEGVRYGVWCGSIDEYRQSTHDDIGPLDQIFLNPSSGAGKLILRQLRRDRRNGTSERREALEELIGTVVELVRGY